MAEDTDMAGIRSERDFMDALRGLKARSGLSYRDIVARISRADPRQATARSTLADLLAGNSLPRRPGQLRLLTEVLAAELNEPELAGRYLRSWSRLIAARGAAGPRTVPVALAGPAASASVRPRPAASVPLQVCPRASPARAATPAEPAPPRGRRNLKVMLIWLVLSLVYYPAAYVIGWLFWVIWLAFTIPLLLILLAGDRKPRPALGDAPSEYLRAEYGATWPAPRSGLASRRY
jgi:hypothetical protein